jgi:diadenosine tetraphosphate (Ap4A) HIT family hydrolase
VTALTAEEWADLRLETTRATDALRSAFEPDHFNYSFLQNMDRHVHLRILPRYARSREFSGETFKDGRYPDHYDPFAIPRPLAAEKTEELAALLRAYVS